MGLLDNIKYNAQQLARGLLNAPQSISQMFTPDYAQKLANTLQLMPTDPLQVPLQSPMMQREMLNQGLNIAGMAPVLHTVYHGSPHRFDAFNISKIGTGEGAQAYGHGLYFAENPSVAQSYIPKTAYNDTVRKFLNELPENASFDDVMKLVGTGHFTQNQDDVLKALHADDWLGFDYPSQAISQAYKPSLSNFDASNELVNAVKNAGHMYKVDIPDESIPRMLNWDKPLSEQPQEVQPVLRDMLTKSRKSFPGIDPNGNPVAGQIYHLYAQHRGGNANAVSDELKQAGIPGIRYLDGNSRGVGQGSNNYVLFDDQLARILEQNGQPTGLQPWKSGEWPGLLK